jgi:hypothetical protein
MFRCDLQPIASKGHVEQELNLQAVQEVLSVTVTDQPRQH